MYFLRNKDQNSDRMATQRQRVELLGTGAQVSGQSKCAVLRLQYLKGRKPGGRLAGAETTVLRATAPD
jgi:hypothetical protein